MVKRFTFAFAALALALPGAASAQSAPPAPPAPPPPSAPAAPKTSPPAAAPAAAGAKAPAPTSDQIAKAKTLFDLGAKAYESENFPAAIQAFQEAYRLSQRPGPIFSTAQAYRRLYNTDRKLDTLRQALAYYKLYIEKQKVGGRIAEAQQAERDLEAILGTAASTGTPDTPAPQPASQSDAKPKTQLMVSSATKGAMASVDGGELSDLPLFQELVPGDHTLRVTADGFFDDERAIVAGDAGGVYGLDISLREKPALLTIRTDAGASISIDGRTEGTAPLPRPLQLPSGEHLVTVTRTGYRSYSAELHLRRDEQRPLEVTLARTPQRYAALSVLGLAAGGVIATGVLGGLTLGAQARAQELESKKLFHGLTDAERIEHEASRETRDDLRLATFATSAATALVAAVGAGLYVFDRPGAGLPIKLRDDSPKPPEATRTPKVRAFITPLITPTGGGATFHLSL